MDRRVKFLDREGFAAQVIYPTVGLLWEAAVKDPRSQTRFAVRTTRGRWKSALRTRTG